MFNSSQTKITLHTSEPSTILVEEDSVLTVNNTADITLKRSKEDVEITIRTDNLSKTILLPSKNSVAYWSNLLYNGGVGMLVEKNKPKRYTYPQLIYINSLDTLPTYSRFRPSYQKGEMFIHLSLPYMNHFYLNPPDETSTKKSLGFWGFSLGVDYYHTNNQYLHFSANTATNFFVPVPAAVYREGEYESMSTLFFALSNNHKINRFSVGYGVTYGENIWDLNYSAGFDSIPPSREPVRKVSENLGLIFTAYYQTGAHFNIGLIYRPTFIRLRPKGTGQYEHLISLDFAWKLRVKDSRK